MLRFSRHLLTVLVALFVATGAAADPTDILLQTDRAALMTPAEWSAYSDRVSDALFDENEGMREAALRMAVLYGEQLDLDRTDVFEMARIYREHNNRQMRRLAVVAMNAVDDDWGLDLLARSYRFEDDPAVRYTVGAVLLDHAKRHRQGVVEVGEPTVVWPIQ